MKNILIFIIITLSSQVFTSDKVSIDFLVLSKQNKWTKILHYKRQLFGGFQSIIEDPHFFFDPQGRSNPTKELQATYTKIKNDPQLQCQYPARFEFLKSAGAFTQQEVKSCPDFELWKKTFNATSVALVYASQYISNPSSVMGHTFLRFYDPQVTEFLHMTVNYGAEIDNHTKFLEYAFKGIFGGFKGVFYIGPYFVKLHEYTDIDRRDIWEYELNFTAAEIDEMLNHVWELYTNVDFHYYFMVENCAYLPLAILEVARPKLNLVNQFGPYVIPSESLKIVSQAGLVKAINYRPSLRKKIQTKIEAMKKEQVSIYQKIKFSTAAIKKNQDPLILETVMDYYHLQQQKMNGTLGPQEELLFNTAMAQRATLGKRSLSLKQSKPTLPHFSHYPIKLGLASGISNSQGSKASLFSEINLRPAIHELLDLPIGYIKYSEIDLMNSKWRYYFRPRKFVLEQWRFFSFSKLTPITTYDAKSSWKFNFGLISQKSQNCISCYMTDFNFSYGVGFNLFHPDLYLYIAPHFSQQMGHIKNHYRVSIGPELDLIYAPTEKIKWMIHAEKNYRTYPQHSLTNWTLISSKFHYNYSQRWSAQLWLTSNYQQSNYQEAQMGVNYYF